MLFAWSQGANWDSPTIISPQAVFHAAQALLLPQPAAQPVRAFDAGTSSTHMTVPDDILASATPEQRLLLQLVAQDASRRLPPVMSNPNQRSPGLLLVATGSAGVGKSWVIQQLH